AQVVHVGGVLVGGIGAQEAVDDRDRLLVVAHLELGEGAFHQRLLGVGTVRVLGQQAAVGDGGAAPVAPVHLLQALVVELLDRNSLVLVLVLEHALDPRAAGGRQGDHQQEQDQIGRAS